MSSPSWFGDALEAKRQEREDELLRSATHESGHLIANRVAGARPVWVSVVGDQRRAGFTKTSFADVDLADVLVGFCAGEAALATLGWPNPGSGADDDWHRAKLAAIQLAHLSPHGSATDPEYVDAILEAGRRQAVEVVTEHWEAIDVVAQMLAKRLRLAGDELTATLDQAMLKVPAVAAREAAFTRQWDRAMVTLGFARPLRA